MRQYSDPPPSRVVHLAQTQYEGFLTPSQTQSRSFNNKLITANPITLSIIGHVYCERYILRYINRFIERSLCTHTNPHYQHNYLIIICDYFSSKLFLTIKDGKYVTLIIKFSSLSNSNRI